MYPFLPEKKPLSLNERVEMYDVTLGIYPCGLHFDVIVDTKLKEGTSTYIKVGSFNPLFEFYYLIRIFMSLSRYPDPSLSAIKITEGPNTFLHTHTHKNEPYQIY